MKCNSHFWIAVLAIMVTTGGNLAAQLPQPSDDVRETKSNSVQDNSAKIGIKENNATGGSEVWRYLFTFASGGVFIKLLEIGYKEFDRRRSAKVQTSEVVSRNLEPILKSADELLSRIRAWADREGCGRMGTHDPASDSLSPHLANTLYLFSHLWARLTAR